jgi:phosphate transport system substrate-binding protein
MAMVRNKWLNSGFLLLAHAVLLIWGALAQVTAHAEEIRIGGTGGSLPVMQLLGTEYAKLHPDTHIVMVPSLGSTGGMEALLKGAIEVAVTSRPLKDSERTMGALAIEYARSPLAFVTSAKTPINEITMQQLVDIYSGKMDKWPDGTRIRLVLRPQGDSDSVMLQNISPAMRQAKLQAEARPGILLAISDQENAKALESLPGSFGACTVSQIVTEKRALKVLKLDGVEPNAATIAAGRYPHYKPLYLVTGSKSPPAAHQFVAFARSSQGRQILARSGHWVSN